MNIDGLSSILGNLVLSELRQSNLELLKAFERLATGKKINRASDDAAGLAIATRLESQIRGLAMAERNAQMGISMVQTAEGYLGSVTEDVQRIRELSVQAANGTLNDTDRQAIQQEIDALVENIDYTFDSAQFNTQQIFDGGTETFQVGADASGNFTVNFPVMSSSTLGLDTIDVTTQAGAEVAITASSVALDSVLSVRTELGATQNRLESTINSLSHTRLDIQSSLSNIMDANMAEETMNQVRATTILQSQILLASQIKNFSGSLLPLLMD